MLQVYHTDKHVAMLGFTPFTAAGWVRRRLAAHGVAFDKLIRVRGGEQVGLIFDFAKNKGCNSSYCECFLGADV